MPIVCVALVTDGVSLEVPYDLLLNGNIDPAVYAGVTMEQLAENYRGNLPGDMMPWVDLQIAEDGSITGEFVPGWPGSCAVTGEVTIPDTGMNQFQMNFQMCLSRPDRVNQSISGVGTVRGGEFYVISEWIASGDEHGGVFEWIFP